MKYIGNNINIQKLKYLPKRTKTSHQPDRYSNYTYEGNVRLSNGLPTYKYVSIILENSVGKNFDEVFSKVCKVIPKNLQHLFLKEFDKNLYWRGTYSVDSNGNIIYLPWHKYEKKVFKFVSSDIKYGYLDPTSKKIFNSNSDSPYYWHRKDRKPERIKVVVSGIEKTFSKPTKEYYRLLYEDKKLKNKIYRHSKFENDVDLTQVLRLGKMRQKYPSLVETPKHNVSPYSWNNRGVSAFSVANKKIEKILEEEKINNSVKILKHGFDEQTSFRKEKES